MTGNGDSSEETQVSARALGEAARRVAARGHPEPEVLFAYHEHSLGDSEAAKVRSHLVLCSDCADFVLDLASFPEVPQRFPAEVDLDGLVPRWEEIRGAHQADGADILPAASRGAGSATRVMGALAASLILVVALLGFRLATLSRQLAEERAPGPNAPWLELVADGLSVRRATELPVLRVPAEARRIHFTLELGAAGEGARLRARLFQLIEGVEQEVTLVSGLIPDRGRRVSFDVHGGGLQSGTFLLRVEDPKDPSASPVAESTFRLEYDQPTSPH